MERLTVQDLSMFYGCRCEYSTPSGKMEITINGFWLKELDSAISVDLVKPILRPLSDMTNEEALELSRLQYPDNGNIHHSIFIGLRNELVRGTYGGSHITCKYLIQKHFDVFGWIGKGLAIDKTKLELIKPPKQ